ncbi:MAG: cyclopropane-fatty-acyl-phospholipid synthase family protein [Acidobacteriota bacterium]
MKPLIDWVEAGVVPDAAVRFGIRRLCMGRLRRESAGGARAIEARKAALADELASGPIAVNTADANDQHYEVPAAFYQRVLGRYRKYSCGYWPPGVTDFDASEEAMLALSAERAQVADGQRILDMGCGWGSMSLYLAEKLPNASITGVSNSASQREFILGQARERGLDNLEIFTCDINKFVPVGHFDRIVSIEMLEHVRNYRELFERMSGWLTPDGFAFVHIFCHKTVAYPFEVDGDNDWMAKHFFTGGMMPSVDFFDRFNDHLEVAERWLVPGVHYERTSNAWLEKLDGQKEELMPVLAETYGEHQAELYFQRWRLFFLACAELFGIRRGSEWMVAHYRLRPKAGSASAAA